MSEANPPWGAPRIHGELTFIEWFKATQPNRAWAERYHPEFEGAMAFLAGSKKAQRRRIAFRVIVIGLAPMVILLVYYLLQ